MKHLSAFLIIILFLSSCSNMKNQTSNFQAISLDTDWEFKQTSDTSWLPAEVPGTIHTDLLENGIIEDPYYRTNEKDLQWIDKTDWEYRCTFFVEQEILDKEEIELVFEGLDTYADVYLNGKLILQAENMFRQWKVPCKNILNKGQNELLVVLKSPIAIGLEKLEANGFPLPASNDQSENGEMGDKKVSIFSRKAGYHFGWDWGPRLVTSGIWRPVKLVGFNTAKFVDIHFIQNSITAKKASLTAEIEIEANKDFSGELIIDSKQVFTKVQKLEIKKGLHVYKLKFEIEDPKLWWPNGLGEQTIYSFKTSLINKSDPRKPLLDENKTSIGIRTIDLVQEKDEEGNGESFYFEVNGHPVFAKGANYIPNDVFLTRFKPEDYERIVKAAADANMNMLRVWGGGIYENDIFYDLCDKYGIMVWQDFMFACSMYPGDDWFLENVRIEAAENIKRLRNHPSIALWCGNNEIEVAWAEYEEDRGWGWKQRYTDEQRKEIWASYDTLFHKVLPAEVVKLNPEIAYWHSSPSAGMGKLSGDFKTSGDQHYWGVWHGQHPFSDFRKYRARFMSEYGFQSFPELNTVATYALPEEWDIESEVMAAHQRSGIGNLRIRHYMENDYQIPEDFNEFLYVSQLLQAEGIKMAIESHRVEMPYCMGSLYWQLNDCWPVASWSGIDYFGRWKALHYFVKKAFEETILVSFENEDQISFHLVTDKLTNQIAILKQTLIDFDGAILWQEERDLNIPSNSSNLIHEMNLTELFKYGNPSGMVLVSDLISDENLIKKDLHYFKDPKDLELKPAEIDLVIFENDSEFIIQLSADRLTKNVFLSTNLSAYHFSDNYFDLLPGQTKKVTFPKTGTLEEFKNNLKVLHLYETMH